MINLTHNNRTWRWGVDVQDGWVNNSTVYRNEDYRFSDLLDANGDKMRVELPRYKIGFDLRGGK